MSASLNNSSDVLLSGNICGYEIISFLFETKYSYIYQAVYSKTNQSVALKFLKNYGENEGRLSTEVELQKELNSPYIINLIETFYYREYLVLVFPFAKQGDLLTVISNLPSCKLEEKIVKKITRSLLNGLSHLHSLNIVHRDIKLENILVNHIDENDVDVVLSDLGLSEKLQKGEKSVSSVGTLEYASPELIEGLPSDSSSDMWGLGVVIYTLLSGSFPFPTSKESVLKTCISRGFYGFPVRSWTGISEQAKAFIKRLMVCNPSDRMTSKEALYDCWIQE